MQGTRGLLGQWLSNVSDHHPQFKINLYHEPLDLQACVHTHTHKHTHMCVLMGYSISLSTWTLGTDRQVQVLPLPISVILAEERG